VSLQRRLLLGAVLPGLLLAAIGLTTPVTERAQGFDSDGKRYAAMADPDLFKPRFRSEKPWAWRVLTPFLAAQLPFETLRSFQVLAVLSSALSLLLMAAILRRCGFSEELVALGVVLYAGVFWSIKFFFYSPAYIDSMTQVFVLAVLAVVLAGHFAWVPLLLAVGVAQKESILFLAPVVWVSFAVGTGWRSRRSLAYGAALVLPALAVLWVVRTVVEGTGDYTPLSMIASQLQVAMSPANWPRLLLAVFSGLGILPLLVAMRGRETATFLGANPLWLSLLVLGAFFLVAGEDKARLFLYALPAVVVLAVHAVRDVQSLGDSLRVRLWIGLAVALHLYLGHHFTPMGSFEAYMDRMVPMYASDDAVWIGLLRVGAVALLFVGSTAWLVPGALRRPRPH
jgi:hypothetical protein